MRSFSLGLIVAAFAAVGCRPDAWAPERWQTSRAALDAGMSLGVWRQILSSGISGRPPGRAFFGMTYDPLREQSIVFGGQGGSGDLNDTWGWDGAQWALISDGGAGSPPQSYAVGFGYDVARGKTVLFGGYAEGAPMGISGDTWELDRLGAWSLVQAGTAVTPPARAFAGMTYDRGTRQTLLTGGIGRSGATAPDTWGWDGMNWTELSSADGPSTQEGGMTYADAFSAVLYYGGKDDGGMLSSILDAWYGGSPGWSSVNIGGPGPRARFGFTYDSARARVVLVGGLSSGGSAQSDTWEWDGSTWFDNISGGSPGGLDGASLAYDCKRGAVVLFGGSGSGGYQNATWEYGIVDPSDGGWVAGMCPPLLSSFDGGRSDAGAPDAGAADASEDDDGDGGGGGPIGPPVASLGGCASPGGGPALGVFLAALGLLVRRRERR